MSLNVGSLWASLSLNISQFMSGLAQASVAATQTAATMQNAFGAGPQNAINNTTGAVNRLSRSANTAGKDIQRIVGGILISQAFYRLANGIEEAAKAILTFSNNMQTATIAFEYFLGTEDRAKAFVETMKDFAAVTPFTTEQALSQSRRLMAMGFAAESVKNVMQILVDTASATGGTAEQMDRIVLALGQMKTNGYIAGQELRQLAEAGVPIYKILQEQLGLTADQLRKIGKMKISGDLGVAAVLKGLEERYKGAAAKIAETVPGMWSTIQDDFLIISELMFAGPYKSLEKLLRGIRNKMEEMRTVIRTSGLGGLMESIFPPELHTSIRAIVGGFQSLIGSIQILWKALQPVVEMIGASLIRSLAVVIPFIAGVVRAIVNFIAAAMQASPAIKILVQAIIALTVANLAAKALMFLWSVVRLGAICTAVAQAVTFLSKSIQALYIVCTKNPIVGIITLIAAALISLALSSKTVSNWLDSVIGKLGQLGGINVDDILKPTDSEAMKKWTETFNKSLKDMGKNLKGVGKEAAGADKKLKDIMSFDEVYRLEDAADATEDWADAFKDMDMSIPDMPDMSLPGFSTGEIDSDINIPPMIPGSGNPNNGGGNGQPPIDPAPVTSFAETVESAIAKMKLALQPAWETVQVWCANVGNAFATAGSSIGTFFTITIPGKASVFQKSIENTFSAAETSVNTFVTSAQTQLNAWAESTKTSISNWVNNTGTSISNWVTNRISDFGTWVTNTDTSISTWANITWSNFATWAVNVGTEFTNWSMNTQTTVSTWTTNTATSLGTWITNTWTSFTIWATNIGTEFTNWASNTGVTITAWSANTATSFSTWISSTWTNFKIWSANVGSVFTDWASSTWTTISKWSTDTITSIGTWITNTRSSLTTWATNVGVDFTNWATATWSTISKWSANTATSISKWVDVTGTDFVNWLTNTETDFVNWSASVVETFSTWSSDVITTISTWATDSSTQVADWVINTGSDFATWSYDVGTTISTWVTDTSVSIADWATNTGVSISTWVTSTSTSILTWSTTVLNTITTWITNTKTNIATWATGTANNIATWVKTTSANMVTWAKGASSSIGTFVSNTSSNIATWGTNTASNIATWVKTTAANFTSWGTNVMNNIATVGSNLMSNMAAALNNMSGNIGSWIKGTSQGFADWGMNVTKNIGSAVSGMVNSIGGALSAAWSKIKEFASAVGAAVGGFWDSNKEWIVPVGIGLAAVGLGAVAIASGGTLAPAAAAGIAALVSIPAMNATQPQSIQGLERGGFVDKDQLVRMGERNRREVTMPLENKSYMRPFADAVASGIADFFGNQESSDRGNSGFGDRIPVYVHTLIADEKGLKDLERRLEIIRISENQRKGG
jgi:tape measure domain-containing protein